MIVVEKIIGVDFNYINLIKHINSTKNINDYLFIDIETTGFSSTNNSIFLIGCLYYKNNQLNLIQWLSEKESDEYELLFRFSQFIKSFNSLIHYNGKNFDIPFINKRMSLYHIKNDLLNLSSVDIYYELRSYDKYLGFESLKLKEAEKKFGFYRKDTLSGRDLIQLYNNMTINSSNEIIEQLLNHNEDDLIGLFYCIKSYNSIHFFNLCKKTNLYINNIKILIEDGHLILTSIYETGFDANITQNNFSISIKPLFVSIKISLAETILNHYYADYKNYYYLPLEDYVIHKSVGQFVDKKFREPATRENCHIKKRGIFIPLPSNFNIDLPLFKENYKSALNYVELTDSLIDDSDIMKQLFITILSNL